MFPGCLQFHFIYCNNGEPSTWCMVWNLLLDGSEIINRAVIHIKIPVWINQSGYAVEGTSICWGVHHRLTFVTEFGIISLPRVYNQTGSKEYFGWLFHVIVLLLSKLHKRIGDSCFLNCGHQKHLLIQQHHLLVAIWVSTFFNCHS